MVTVGSLHGCQGNRCHRPGQRERHESPEQFPGTSAVDSTGGFVSTSVAYVFVITQV